MRPLISVITLTYKNYDRLFQTIKSVIIQDYPNIEYIISDDGSGDFPEDEVRKFINNNTKGKTFNYKLLVNKKNLGTVKNFNNAINKSSGDFIFPLSCNDFFVDSHVVSKIEDVFNRTKSEIVITSRIKYTNDVLECFVPHINERKLINKLDNSFKQYRALMLSEHYEMFIGCSTYYNKHVFDKYGLFDEEYRLLEDLPFLEKYMWKEKAVLEPELVTIFYDGDTGVTLKKHKTHSLLEQDIDKYNEYGKNKHFNELDRKTRNHIKFGIERAKTTNKGQFLFLCIKYLPRVSTYFFYLLKRYFASINDKKYLDKYSGSFDRYKNIDNIVFNKW